MLSKILIAMAIFSTSCLVQAGFSGTRLAYGAGPNFPPPVAYNSNFGTPYAAPLPVAPFRDGFPYNTLTYSAPSFVKLRGSGGGGVGFRCGPSLHARPKFAIPAPVPAVYDAPLPVDDGSADVVYTDFEVPTIVAKFGPPITTTTTTYSTSATAAAGVHQRISFKAAHGW